MAERFATKDVESTLALLSAVRGAVRVRSSDEHAEMELDHRTLGPVGIDHTRFSMDLDVDVGPAAELIIGQVDSGAVGFRTVGTEHWHITGGIYLAAQSGHRRTSMVRGGEHEQALIEPALLSQVVATAPGRRPQPLRFTGYHAVSPQAAQAWKNAYAYARDTVLASPDAATQPLIASATAHLLAATALAVFPNNALTDPTIEDRHDAHPATLRRAIAFIDENAHNDITVADIAAAASVTIRSVQLAFRRHHDTTPLEYLRRVRLANAHQDLLAADPTRTTVTAVAYRWGFPAPAASPPTTARPTASPPAAPCTTDVAHGGTAA